MLAAAEPKKPRRSERLGRWSPPAEWPCGAPMPRPTGAPMPPNCYPQADRRAAGRRRRMKEGTNRFYVEYHNHVNGAKQRQTNKNPKARCIRGVDIPPKQYSYLSPEEWCDVVIEEGRAAYEPKGGPRKGKLISGTFKKCIYCGQPAQNVDGIWHYFDYTHVFLGEEIKKWGMEGGFATTGRGRNKGVRNAGPACAFCGGFKRACDPFKWVYHLHMRGMQLLPHHAHWAELQRMIEEGGEGEEEGGEESGEGEEENGE